MDGSVFLVCVCVHAYFFLAGRLLSEVVARALDQTVVASHRPSGTDQTRDEIRLARTNESGSWPEGNKPGACGNVGGTGDAWEAILRLWLVHDRLIVPRHIP